jgi:hypothetical protein
MHGINIINVNDFIKKPFIEKGPDGELTAHKYRFGELSTYDNDWSIEYYTEAKFIVVLRWRKLGGLIL